MARTAWGSLALRWLGLLLVCGLALQLYFAASIVVMRWVDWPSTAFQRSEFWRVVVVEHRGPWQQRWRPYAQISPHLKRAVIASEDASFADHSGFEWDAIEKAWARNEAARARAERLNEAAEQRAQARAKASTNASLAPVRTVEPRIVGGSTISQQLAKNLFLSGERTAVRKAQEFALTFMLEAALDKQRILELYLNHVEWGEGVFGAQAAAQRYFRVDAAQLGPGPAARLAVMLPAPKRFEKQPGSAYVSGRAATIVARMGAVDLP